MGKLNEKVDFVERSKCHKLKTKTGNVTDVIVLKVLKRKGSDEKIC